MVASEGPRSASTFASVDDNGFGSNAWSDAGNAAASDDSRATATAPTASLKTTGYGFSIPSDAAVDGIEVEVEGTRTGSNGTAVHLYKAGVVAGGNITADWSSTEQYHTYGSPTFKWGTSWSPADINDAGFGAAVWGWQGTGTRSVDHIRITVYYTEAIVEETIEGAQAAPSGEIAAKQFDLVEGAPGAPAGVLTFLRNYFVALAGMAGEPSGGLVDLFKKPLAGAQGAPSGGLTVAAQGYLPVVKSTTQTLVGSNDSTPTFNMPATRPNGDLYLLHVAHDAASTTQVAFTGWNLLQYEFDGTAVGEAWFWRIGSSEPASYTGSGPSEEYVFHVMRIQGFRRGDPFDVEMDANAGTTSAAAAPDVTPGLTGGLVLRGWAIDTDNPSVSAPASHGLLGNSSSSAGGAGSVYGAVAQRNTRASAGVGVGSATLGGTYDDEWAAGTVVIAPSVGAPAGMQGAPSGVLDIDTGTVEVGIGGTQLAPSGVIQTLQYALVEGAGGEPSGDLALVYRIAIEGEPGAPSGEVAAGLFEELAGLQPASLGDIVAVFANKLVTGAPGAPSGQLAALQLLARMIEGQQDVPSATVDALIAQYANVGGLQGEPDGALVVTWVEVNVAGLQPPNAGAVVALKVNVGFAPMGGRARNASLGAGRAGGEDRLGPGRARQGGLGPGRAQG